MPYYQKDVCPRCRADVSRRIGLITTPTITCRVCQFPMRVTALAVMNNWQFNFAAPVVLAIWVGAAVIIFRSPDMVARWASELGVNPSGHATQDRLAMVLLSGVLALFCSIPFAVLGRLVGFYAARRLLSEPPPEAAASELGQRQFVSQLPTPVGREQTSSAATVVRTSPAAGAYVVEMHSARDLPPRRASGGFRFIARGFFGLLWAAFFFVGGAFVMGAVATAGIADPELRNQASRHAGEHWGVWLFLGSIGLTILLGSLGILPGTRSKKRPA
jgi:hypothetical protein